MGRGDPRFSSNKSCTPGASASAPHHLSGGTQHGEKPPDREQGQPPWQSVASGGDRLQAPTPGLDSLYFSWQK